MNLMQASDNWIWFAAETALTLLSIIAVWFVTLVGRDRNPTRQKRGEEGTTKYADVEEDHSPLPKFLILTYIVFGAWMLGYLFSTGIFGLI